MFFISEFGFANVENVDSNLNEAKIVENIITVKLLDSQGNGLEGGEVKYYLNGWKDANKTNEDGLCFVSLPEGKRDIQVQMKYLGMKKTIKQNINDNSEFIFETIDTVVKLEDSNGNGLEGGEIIYSSWTWKDFGIINQNGEIHRELLPGVYNFRMEYEGGRVTLKQDTNENSNIIFNTKNTMVMD